MRDSVQLFEEFWPEIDLYICKGIIYKNTFLINIQLKRNAYGKQLTNNIYSITYFLPYHGIF